MDKSIVNPLVPYAYENLMREALLDVYKRQAINRSRRYFATISHRISSVREAVSARIREEISRRCSCLLYTSQGAFALQMEEAFYIMGKRKNIGKERMACIGF